MFWTLVEQEGVNMETFLMVFLSCMVTGILGFRLWTKWSERYPNPPLMRKMGIIVCFCSIIGLFISVVGLFWGVWE